MATETVSFQNLKHVGKKLQQYIPLVGGFYDNEQASFSLNV
jgi:hypothetical protein